MSEAGAVLAHWNLRGTVEQVTSGTINAVWRVQTVEGGWRYLRAYRTTNQDAVEREHMAIATALQAGVATPAVLPLSSGDSVLRHGGQLWALFEAATGRQVERSRLTPDHAHAVGCFLAEMHLRLPPNGPEGLPVLTLGSLDQTTRRLETIRAAMLALPAPDERDGWALTRTEQRLRHLQSRTDATRITTLPFRFLHGDVQDSNLFFSEGRVTSVIDWENARAGPCAWELVRLLHLSLHLEPERCRACLDGYRQVSPLSDDELAEGARWYGDLQERNVWLYESVFLEGNPGPRVFLRPPPYVPFEQSWSLLVTQLR